MSIPTNWRNQSRERSLSGYQREVLNINGELVIETSLDGSHWTEAPAIANTVVQTIIIMGNEDQKDAA